MGFRRLLIYVATVMTSVMAAAELYAQEDALMVWSTTTINKSLGKDNRWTLRRLHLPASTGDSFLK